DPCISLPSPPRRSSDLTFLASLHPHRLDKLRFGEIRFPASKAPPQPGNVGRLESCPLQQFPPGKNLPRITVRKHGPPVKDNHPRSEEHTSELQSRENLV